MFAKPTLTEVLNERLHMFDAHSMVITRDMREREKLCSPSISMACTMAKKLRMYE